MFCIDIIYYNDPSELILFSLICHKHRFNGLCVFAVLYVLMNFEAGMSKMELHVLYLVRINIEYMY